ncbi:methyl-accepting chemotaxis protein [Shewanella sp. 125m-7]
MTRKQVSLINQEVKLTPTDQLISTTDRRGVITYVNQRFIEVSGFSETELIGNNHNMVRHPDMPKAAFKEMWSKLEAGISWRGVVKNRCKDGRYYWVDAFVSPLFEKGQLIGYQSVRMAASPQLTNKATEIYQRLNQGKRVDDPISLANKRLLSAICASTGLLIAGAIWGWAVIIAGIILMAVNLAIFYDEAFKVPARLMKMKQEYDSISRFIYCGRDTSSLLDFQLMMKDAKLQGVLGRSQDNAEHIEDIASQLIAAAQQTHVGLNLENQQIELIASATEEMGSTISEVAKNTQSTSESIQQTYQVCHESREKMQQNAISINQLSDSVAEAAANANLLNKEAELVASAMSEIDSIAEQTNLLALNAAIEAARAGDQGRGFAVVADEVRALSSRTQQSTTSISKSVDKMFSMLTEWSKQMDNSKSKALLCSQDAEKSANKIDTIYQSMKEIQALAVQNAVAAEQQTLVVGEINQNITQISQASSENLCAVNLVEASVKELKFNAEKAKSLRKTFS